VDRAYKDGGGDADVDSDVVRKQFFIAGPTVDDSGQFSAVWLDSITVRRTAA